MYASTSKSQDSYNGFGIFTFIRSIWTVYKRQNARLINSKSQLISIMIMPLLWLVIIGQSFNNLLGSSNPLFSGNVNYITYMTPGIFVMITMFSSLFGIISLFYDRDSGYLKNYLLAPISNTAIIFGYAMGIYTRVFIQVLLILVIAIAIGANIPITVGSLTAIILFPVVVSFFLSGLAITLASRASNVETFQAIIMPISMPLMFLSPILYPIKALPDYLQWIAQINPLSMGVEGLRFVLLGKIYTDGAIIDIAQFNDHLAIFNFALLFLVGIVFLIMGSKTFLNSLYK